MGVGGTGGDDKEKPRRHSEAVRRFEVNVSTEDEESR